MGKKKKNKDYSWAGIHLIEKEPKVTAFFRQKLMDGEFADVYKTELNDESTLFQIPGSLLIEPLERDGDYIRMRFSWVEKGTIGKKLMDICEVWIQVGNTGTIDIENGVWPFILTTKCK